MRTEFIKLLFYTKFISFIVHNASVTIRCILSLTFQLGSQYLACHMISMQRNCRKNSSMSGSTPPMNLATLLPPFAYLLSKGHVALLGRLGVRVKYMLGLVFRVTVKVSINIRLFALYLIHRYSVDGITGGYRRMCTMNSGMLFLIHRASA